MAERFFTDYVQNRWGLAVLALGIGVLGLWTFGGSGKKEEGRRGEPRAGKRPGRTPGQGATTPKAVQDLCARAGIAAARPAMPNPAAVRAPRIPRPLAKTPRLGPASRGIFTLRKRLAGVAVKGLPYAPLLHRAARGYLERTRYFAHLSTHPRAAERYIQNLQRLRGRTMDAATPGAARAPTMTPATLGVRAKLYRKYLHRYYGLLTSSARLKRYARRADAMFEYAEVLLHEGRKEGRVQAMKLLHRLVAEHPASPAAVETAVFLAARERKAGQCAKVVLLLKGLPTGKLKAAAWKGRAVARATGHYHAGACLARQGKHEAAIKRLKVALHDALQAPRSDKKAAQAVTREASIALARSFAAGGDVAQAWSFFAQFGDKLAKLQAGVLVAGLIKAGNLRQAAELCRAARRPNGNNNAKTPAKP